MGRGGPKSKPIALDAVLNTCRNEKANINLRVTALQALVPMRAYEARPLLEKMAADKKGLVEMREAAEDVAEALTIVEAQDAQKKAKADKKAGAK